MGLNNVSERIESHGDEIREELDMCEGSVFEAIKNMSKEELALILETNYKKGGKEAKAIELDHGWAAVVQAALTHLGFGGILGKIDGVYGKKTEDAAKAYQKSKWLTGSGYAMHQTLWKMIIDLRDPTYVADLSGNVTLPEVVVTAAWGTETDKPWVDSTELTPDTTTTLNDLLANNNIFKYWSDITIKGLTWTVARYKGAGKVLGNLLNLSDRDIQANLPKIYDTIKSSYPALYAYALHNAMKWGGTRESVVSTTIWAAKEHGILDKVYTAFGKQKNKNLIQWFVDDYATSSKWEERTFVLNQIKDLVSITNDNKILEDMQQLFFDTDNNGFTRELKEDKGLTTKLGIAYAQDNNGVWKWQKENTQSVAISS